MPQSEKFFSGGRRCGVSGLIALAAAGVAEGQGAVAWGRHGHHEGGGDAAASPRWIEAVRAPGGVRVDGRPDEAVWSEAGVAADWVQRRPTSGAAPSQRSEARVLYDEGALYIAFRLEDTAPDSILAPLTRRDSPGASDRVYVLLDSYLDRRTAFRFGVSAAGVKSDARLSGDREEGADGGWTAVWDAAVSRDSAGWSAELRIPFSQLRFRRGEGEPGEGNGRVWGIQFVRVIGRSGEQVVWSPSPLDGGGFVSRFGELRGLAVPAARHLEAMPYLRVGTVAGGPAGGADLRYGPGPDLTLTATLLPDFGQVEADPSEVNLTGRETFLEERRPFFVEGAEIFRFPLAEVPWVQEDPVFYSRRIGASASLLGAAKLSGRAGDWSVGVLEAVTRDEGEAGDGSRAPLTNHAVVRVTRDFREGRSGVGAVGTGVLRRSGATGQDAVTRALVGGVDGRHRFGRDRFEASGALALSGLAGDAAGVDAIAHGPVHYFQRPDARHLDHDPERTTLSGLSAGGRVERLAGGFWRYGVAGRMVTPGFDANELGFHTDSDYGRAHTWVGYQHFRATAGLREWVAWWNGWSAWSLGGERVETGMHLFGELVRLDNRWGWLSLRHEFASLSRDRLRGGPAVHSPSRSRVRFHAGGDPGAPVWLAVGGNAVREWETGGLFDRFQTTLNVRLSPRATFMIEPAIERVEAPWQYVGVAPGEADPRYVVARMGQTTAALTTRAGYTFTPDLTVELYAQPFLSTGRFTDYREVERPRARRFEDRFVPLDAPWSGRTPDFDVQELNANLVVRWEYQPGSVLFLVWSQSRDRVGPGDPFHFGHHARRLAHAPPENRLVLKASYWFGR
jgi:hypothetical protein